MLQIDLKIFIRKNNLPVGILLGFLICTSVAMQAQPTSTALFVSESQYVYGENNVQSPSSKLLAMVPVSDSSLVKSRTIRSARWDAADQWTVWIRISSILFIFLIIVSVTVGNWVRAFKLP